MYKDWLGVIQPFISLTPTHWDSPSHTSISPGHTLSYVCSVERHWPPKSHKEPVWWSALSELKDITLFRFKYKICWQYIWDDIVRSLYDLTLVTSQSHMGQGIELFYSIPCKYTNVTWLNPFPFLETFATFTREGFWKCMKSRYALSLDTAISLRQGDKLNLECQTSAEHKQIPQQVTGDVKAEK